MLRATFLHRKVTQKHSGNRNPDTPSAEQIPSTELNEDADDSCGGHAEHHEVQRTLANLAKCIKDTGQNSSEAHVDAVCQVIKIDESVCIKQYEPIEAWWCDQEGQQFQKDQSFIPAVFTFRPSLIDNDDDRLTKTQKEENQLRKLLFEIQLLNKLSANNTSAKRYMNTILSENGLQCFGETVRKIWISAFLDYVFQNKLVATCAIHKVDQVLELQDWIIGETQRLVNAGKENVEEMSMDK